MAANDGAVLDEDGDDSDWVEVFQCGSRRRQLRWLAFDRRCNQTQQVGLSSTNAEQLVTRCLVFASDKDRGDTGEELHTNFKLTSNGEYLALTRNTTNGGIEVVSDFSPAYPQQTENISYGFTQEVTTDTLVEPGAAAKLLVPTSEPGSSWKDLNFNDSSWQNATSTIGYQTSVPGFTVLDAKSTSSVVNLSDAERVLNGTGQRSATTAITPVVDFFDTGGRGRYGGDLPFPNNTGSDDNDFAIRATGTITIPTSGWWTFGTNSDDGVRVRINGQNVINDDSLHAPQDRFGRVSLDAGQHELELVFFERGGGAEVELFAAAGQRTTFSASAFRLIGDVDNGGLVVTTSPTAGGSGLSDLIETTIENMHESASSALLARAI